MNTPLNNIDIQSPIITTDSSQGTINTFQNNSNYTNEILNRINNSPYFRIVFEEKNCCSCDNSIYISVYTLSIIDDINPSKENQNFLLKAVLKLNNNCCDPKDFEIKCFTGSNFNSANDYFCTFRIKKEDCCNNLCNNLCNCKQDIILNPMTLNIAPNKLEISNENIELCYGRIERFLKLNCCISYSYNIRKFFAQNENVFKYQIGKVFNCECNFINDCNCEKCSCENCSCENDCSFYCGCCLRKRYLFKIILDNRLNQCGEFNYVSSEQCCKQGFYDIRFPNDANVLMKLLLLGGLFEATLLPYFSYSDNQKTVNASRNNTSFIIIYYSIMIIFLMFYIYISIQSIS